MSLYLRQVVEHLVDADVENGALTPVLAYLPGSNKLFEITDVVVEDNQTGPGRVVWLELAKHEE